MVAVEHDHPGAGAEDRSPVSHQRPQRLGQPLALNPERHHGRFAPRDDQGIEAVEVGRHAYLARLRSQGADHLGVRLEVPLQGENADELRHAYQPRVASSFSASSLELSRLTIG